jgi:mitochondrial fission protein ELM1
MIAGFLEQAAQPLRFRLVHLTPDCPDMVIKQGFTPIILMIEKKRKYLFILTVIVFKEE